eukprot:GHVS01040212.1.p1 GENE.GHVS01040212.1~~GHVS01040212.1.p1  ORF type:complete len:412 (-),score=23.07 GHVS01040212.1:172-1407(-)
MKTIDEVTDGGIATGTMPNCTNPDVEIVVPDQQPDGGTMAAACVAGKGYLRILDTRWGEEQLLSDPVGNIANITMPTYNVAQICDLDKNCNFTIDAATLGDHPDPSPKEFRMWYQCIPGKENATVGEWGAWSSCTATCGDSTHTHERVQVSPAVDGGMTLDELGLPLNATGTCDFVNCPVDATVSAWTAWGSCSKCCNTGSQSRSRQQTAAEEYGGLTLDQQGLSLTSTQDCLHEPCGCFEVDVNYSGYDVTSYTGVANPSTCQSKCESNSSCAFFQWANSSKKCWLKSSRAFMGSTSDTSDRLVVGPKQCGNGGDNMKSASVQERSTGSFSCPSGRNIQIVGALWGGPSQTTGGGMSCQNEQRNKSRSNCDNKNACNSIHPMNGNSGTWELGDPCFGIVKTVYFWYNCIT